MIQEAILMMMTVTRNPRQTTTRSQNDSPEERNQPTEEEAVILHLHQVAATEEDHRTFQHPHPAAVTAAVTAAAAAAATATATTAVATELDRTLTGESTPRNPKWVASQTDSVGKKLGLAGNQITIGQGWKHLTQSTFLNHLK